MAMLKFDIKNKAHIYQLIAGITAVTLILIGCLVILSPFFPAILLAVILAPVSYTHLTLPTKA